ncbi:MAG: hypothetical protein M3Z32_03795, partial [Acidobacteriota bacterium]|nr:hypothetical protein [Acidobacteriota bacterium]
DQTEVVVPLAPGLLWPPSFSAGVPSAREIAKLRGVRLIPSNDVAVGASADVYAFTRRAVQRNLYRIPLP